MRQVNAATRALVKSFEGLRLNAYLCPAGKPTIGFGHTSGVSLGDGITADEADELLEQDLEDAGRHVDGLIRVKLNENQFGALCSFVFNLGPGNLLTSTLRDRLNKGDYRSVPDQLRQWNHARGFVLEGLTRRRAAEAALWETPVEEAAVVRG